MFTDSVTIFLKLFKIVKFLMGLEVIRDWNLGGNQKSEISKKVKPRREPKKYFWSNRRFSDNLTVKRNIIFLRKQNYICLA